MNNLIEFASYMQERAHWTHEIINNGFIKRVGIMEETITDMHLLDIAIKYDKFVLTRKFNKREEGATSGADWLWIIGEPGSWLFLLIQAKIINPRTKNCLHLDYQNGQQRERLMRYARRHGFIPAYCIYSYIDQSIILRERKLGIETFREDWACSFLSPKSVRDLSEKKQKSQKDILKYAIPWMDPFIIAQKEYVPYGRAIANSLMKSRDTMTEFLKNNSSNLMNGYVDYANNQISLEDKWGISEISDQFNSAKSIRKHWDNFDTQQGVKSEIPLSIINLFIDQDLKGVQPPFSNASIISKAPIELIPEINARQKRKSKN